MFRKNQDHLQWPLLSTMDELPEKQRQILEQSWAGVFYHEFFCRLDEQPFAVLYSAKDSRPNIPVNLLVGLETLKAGFGWSDSEMYEHFLFDVQVRYALGLRNLGEESFELRSVYNFRQRLSAHMQESGENLLDRAFAQVSDEQIQAFRLQTQRLRMDSTQVASNIRQMTRLQLLVEMVQRVQRILSSAEQERYASLLAPYLKGSSAQYVYHLRGEETASHLQGLGELLLQLLQELEPAYASHPVYQMVQRVFGEQFSVADRRVQVKPGEEISPNRLRSPDDPQATYRRKGQCEYEGYVTSVTETCDPDNALQLIVKVQTAANTTEDTTLLAEAMPELKERTAVTTLYTDAGYCGQAADQALNAAQVQQVPTDLRGKAPNPAKLHLEDFGIECTAQGQPLRVTCPQGHTVPVESGRNARLCLAYFAAPLCQDCPRRSCCPARPRKLDGRRTLRFEQRQVAIAQRRQRCAQYRQSQQNLRAAIEAVMGAIKRPFTDDQLPVRGLFRMGYLLLTSALMINIRRIHRYLSNPSAPQGPQDAPSTTAKMALPDVFSLALVLPAFLQRLRSLLRPVQPADSFGC